MPFRVSIPSVACGLLLVLSGCYSYPSYGPGGPGYYGPPQGRIMGPQPGPNLGGPTPVIPDGATGTTPDGAWRNPSQPGATYDPLGAPPIGSGAGNGSTREEIGTQKAVPDPSKIDGPGSNLNDAVPKSSPEDTFLDDPKPGPGASLPRDSGDSFGADDSDMQFKEPIEVTPASSNGKVSATLADAQNAGPNPFDYDRKEYRHLQGTVEYVKEERAWHLMYSAAPDAADKFGGDITLHDHVGLKGLKENDVIYVEGHVDAQSKDATGKPRYHIEHLRKLVPKQRL